jgi:surface protein
MSVFTTKADLQTAVDLWITNMPDAMIAYGDINSWDVTAVTDMSSLFEGKNTFNSNINGWNVSNVTTMYRMFYGASNFNQDLNSWTTSSVTHMGHMFWNAEDFNGDISSWNVVNVTHFIRMFSHAKQFNRNISNWNLASATHINYMFNAAEKFNQNISAWNVANVIATNHMFFQAKKFNQSIGNWNVGNVTDMRYMFYQAYDFNQDISSWDVGAVTNMQAMFRNAEAFNQNISTWTVSNVTNMVEMFRNAIVFNQDLSPWCVPHSTTAPTRFDLNAYAWILSRPFWGTCPSVGGDPYVTPIYGPQYKLPDREACYRLFERGNVFINGLVKEASEQKQQAILDYAQSLYAKHASTLDVAEASKLLSLDNLLLNGYFFDAFLIYSEDKVLYVDLVNKQFKTDSQEYFAIEQKDKKSVGISNTNLYKNSKYTKVTVNWKHSEFGNMNSFVSFYDNPQIDNGISISKASTTKDCVGLLMYNYKPKLMEIPKLATLTHKKLHKRLKNAKNKFINKRILLKSEEWRSISANAVKSVENKDIRKY